MSLSSPSPASKCCHSLLGSLCAAMDVSCCRQFRSDQLFIPGVLTPSEIVQTEHVGAAVLKLFPAGPLGKVSLRDLLGPFRGRAFLPTGGMVTQAPALSRSAATTRAPPQRFAAAQARVDARFHRPHRTIRGSRAGYGRILVGRGAARQRCSPTEILKCKACVDPHKARHRERVCAAGHVYEEPGPGHSLGPCKLKDSPRDPGGKTKIIHVDDQQPLRLAHGREETSH